MDLKSSGWKFWPSKPRNRGDREIEGGIGCLVWCRPISTRSRTRSRTTSRTTSRTSDVICLPCAWCYVEWIKRIKMWCRSTPSLPDKMLTRSKRHSCLDTIPEPHNWCQRSLPDCQRSSPTVYELPEDQFYYIVSPWNATHLKHRRGSTVIQQNNVITDKWC